MEDSILFPGVMVEEGARVRGCILFRDTVIRRNADVACIITDKRVEILADRTLIGHASYPLVVSKDARV